MGKQINYTPSRTVQALWNSPKNINGIRGPVGCLPYDAEVMTRGGWVKIGAWRESDGEILEWSPGREVDGEGRGVCGFAMPKRKIDAPCADGMIRFRSKRHLEMVLTDAHRVPLYDWRGRFVVKRAGELAERLSRHVVPVVWRQDGDGVALTDDEIRLWVAVCADGIYPAAGNQCEFRMRRERKISRLEEMLSRMGIGYEKRLCDRRDSDREWKITIARPATPKHFDWRVTGFNSRQATVFTEELRYWDGLFDSGYDRYDTSVELDAVIVQYVAHVAGRRACITSRKDPRNEKWATMYSVHIAREGSSKNRVQIRCDGTEVDRVEAPDGRQYCFETHSGFFVARYHGRVFVTGNSGKSVGCCFFIWLKSMEQKPCKDGVVRNRWLVLRNTLPELRDTTVQTWLHWFPMTEMNWTPPYHGRLVMPHYKNPKVRVEIELIFYGCDQPDFEEKLKSLEITGVWANEACQIRWSTLQQAYSRCGRYPSKEDDRSFYSWGLLMDTNSPSDANWWYRKECVERPADMAFFVQPPALLEHVRPDGSKWYEPNRGQDPADPRPAENVEHLNEGFGYYMKQISVLDDDEIKRLLLNQFGTSLAGKPIYPEFKDSVHVSPTPLVFNAGMTLILGTDFGRTPACVIGQMSNTGQIRILEEIVSEGMGITQFTDELLRPLLVRKYRLLEGTRIVNFADPSGKSGTQVDDMTCIQRMNERGIYTKVSKALVNNSFIQRRECVSDLLRQRRDGEPALIIDPSCTWLRRGFNGGYCYKKLRTDSGGDERYADGPDKTNPFSHPHDALQYLCFGAIYGSEDYSIPSRRFGGGLAFRGLPSAGVDVGGFGV